MPDSRPDAGAAETVVTAQAKFHCPACGGEAQWNPAKQLLICPFCGTESPATLETRKTDTVVVEHDLVAALRDIPDAARARLMEIADRCPVHETLTHEIKIRSRLVG